MSFFETVSSIVVIFIIALVVYVVYSEWMRMENMRLEQEKRERERIALTSLFTKAMTATRYGMRKAQKEGFTGALLGIGEKVFTGELTLEEDEARLVGEYARGISSRIEALFGENK